MTSPPRRLDSWCVPLGVHPAHFCGVMVAFFAALLAADQFVGLRGQLVLSGAVSGYVLFDLVALAAAPHLMRAAASLRQKGVSVTISTIKRRLAPVAAAAAAVAVLGAPPASASSSQARELALLKRQVAALKKDVTTMKRQIRTLNRAVNVLGGGQVALFAGLTCQTALMGDLFLGTWGAVDQLAQATQGRTYFGQQPRLDDRGRCANLRNPTVTRPGVTVPPSLAILNPMIAWSRLGD